MVHKFLCVVSSWPIHYTGQCNDVNGRSQLLHKISPSTSATTALKKCMIQSVGERDFSAQETAHLLLILPLYRCSYSFITLSGGGGGSTHNWWKCYWQCCKFFYSWCVQSQNNSFPDVSMLNLQTYSITKGEPTKWTYPVTALIQKAPCTASTNCTFVAISRLGSLSNGLFHPMH